MKIKFIFVNFLFAALAAFAQPTHTAKITIHVVDETGKPVTNAPVSTFVIDGYRAGSAWWGDVPNYKKTTVRTDEHGVAVMTAPGAPQEFSYVVMDLTGYYFGGGTYVFKEPSIIGRWQPWNPTVELVLKAVGVQAPMYARKVWDEKIPDQGKPVGFDLMVGDWVSPYGKGIMPDFIFRLDSAPTKTMTNWYGNLPRPVKLYDNKLTIQFSNEGDGIQFVKALGGGLRLPRLAPTDGYQPTSSKRDWLEQATNQLNRPFAKWQSDYNKDANYFFRVRTKKDAAGNIVSALYGKIYGDFSQDLGHGKIYFFYYLNPEPNSRNMEFDPKQNLFKNLKPLEQVAAP
jgi:hypothetical protein